MTIPPTDVVKQAQSMADAEQQKHFITKEADGSWLVSPEKPGPELQFTDHLTVVAPRYRKRGLL